MLIVFVLVYISVTLSLFFIVVIKTMLRWLKEFQLTNNFRRVSSITVWEDMAAVRECLFAGTRSWLMTLDLLSEAEVE